MHQRPNFSNRLIRKLVIGQELQGNLNVEEINNNSKCHRYHLKIKIVAATPKDKDKVAVLLVKTNHPLKQETETQEELKEPICNNKYLQRHQT